MEDWHFAGYFSIFGVLAVWYMADGTMHPQYISAFMAINTVVRLFFPSQYAPRRMTPGYGYLSSPFLARTLATIAEPLFLEALAMCLGLGFWGSFMGNATIIGELCCWSCLLTQSHMLGEIEDSIWMIIQIYAVIYGVGPFRYLLSLPFAAYLLIFHLPRMIGRKHSFTINLTKWQPTHVEPIDWDSYAWMVPSLLC